MSEDDMAGTARGPNYNWKHEADHYRAECEKLRELLGKVETSWEREAASLESRLAQLEKRSAWQGEMIERAKDLVHMALDCPNCCTRSVQTFNADLEAGPQGKEKGHE